MRRKNMPGCSCCGGCSSLCGGPPRICGIELESAIHTEALTFSESDLTWFTNPSGAQIPSLYFSHPYRDSPDWEFCYVNATSIPAFTEYTTPERTQTDSFSVTACSAARSGTITRKEDTRYSLYRFNRSTRMIAHITIHRNVTTGLFVLSLYVNCQLETTTRYTGTYGVAPAPEDPIFVSRQLGVPSETIANYNGWRLFNLTDCESVFATKTVAATSPALFSPPDPDPLDTAFVSAVSCGSTANQRINFGDFSVRRNVTPNIGITTPPSEVAAPEVYITLIQCE